MSATATDTIGKLRSALRDALHDLDNASSSVDDALDALKQLGPDPEATENEPDPEALDHLFRVIRSIVNQDGVFDLYDLALASDDAKRDI